MKKRKIVQKKKNTKNVFDIIIRKAKKLTAKNYINIILLLLILISSTYVFFQYKMIFFPDGQLYYSLSRILLGQGAISSWSAVRGFGFPLIIAIWATLFGDTSFGLVVGSFTFYLFLILGIGFLLQKYIKENRVENKLLFFFLYLLIVVFNPLVIGYQHTLLTEAIMPSIYLLVVLLCLKWYKINCKESKTQYIIINIMFVLLGIFIWFIKQPYAPAFYIAILLTAIFSGIYYKSFKEFGIKLITLFICLGAMILSVMTWDSFLGTNNAASANDINSSFMISSINNGLNVYYYYIKQDIYCNEEYIYNSDISDKEKDKIFKIKETDNENWCSHFSVYEIKDENKNHIATEVIISKDNRIDLMENLYFLLKNIIKHPTLVLKSYFYNYLAIADIQERDLSRGLVSSLKYEQYVWGENLSNGMYPLTIDNDTLIGANAALSRFNEKTTPTNIDLMNILLINNTLCFYLYRLLIFLALPIFIYSFIKFINKKDNNYFIMSIISLMTFTGAFFHVFTGHVIDRYAYPMYPLMILCMLIMFMDKKKKEHSK